MRESASELPTEYSSARRLYVCDSCYDEMSANFEIYNKNNRHA